MSTQRTVTVFSTAGKRKSKIETDVTTWADLKKLVTKDGYNLDKLLATENITRRDLANEGAILPEGDFTLFLRPTKTKSGGDNYDKLSFKELRAELSDDDKSAMSEQYDKNYTRCSGDDIKDYLRSKGGKTFGRPAEPVKTSKTDAPKKEKKSSQTVADVVESVKESPVLKEKKAKCEDITKESIILKLQDAWAMIADGKNAVEACINQLAELQVGESEEEIAAREEVEAKALEQERQAKEEAEAKLQKIKEQEEEEAKEKAEKEARKQAEAEEEARLEQEAKDMMAGF
jgi:hypothetical protein